MQLHPSICSIHLRFSTYVSIEVYVRLSLPILVGREVQNCKLKKFVALHDDFRFSNGHIERFPALPHRHSEFRCAPWWIFSGWIFWRPFFGGFCCSYCRKTHTENSGKISVEKFGENIPFFGAFFGALFSTFFGAFSVSNFLPRNRKISYRIGSAREIP